jgi:peptidyl-prolyl cis-trans isomerase SurA
MMRWKLPHIFFYIIFFFNFTFLYGIETKIIAMVNNEPITTYELKNKIITTLILSNQNINQEIIDRSKSAAMNSLINYKLKKNEIEKFKIETNQKSIDLYLNKIASNDIELFKKKFINNSIDYQIFLNEIKVELAWQKLIYSKYSDKVKIDDNLIKNELDQLFRKENNQNEYKLSEIEIEITKENKQNKINQVLEEINTFGFAETARKLSISSTAIDNGNLGWVNEKSLSKQMNEVLTKMKINEISVPVTKLNIVSFFKIIDKRIFKIDNKNKDALKKDLINQKTNELFKLYSNNHLSKIKNSSFIKFR